jgi:hypothetical protein
MTNDVVDTLISPEGRLEVLSKAEVAKLLDTSQGGCTRSSANARWPC